MVILSVLIMSFPLFAETPDVFIKAEGESVYPMNDYEVSHAQFKDYAYELVKAILIDSKLKYSIDYVPWARAYKAGLSEKNILLFPLGRTQDREQQFKWVGKIIDISYSLYCNSNTVQSAAIPLERIKTKVIGAPHQGLRQQFLEKHNYPNVIYTSSNNHTHKLFVRDRIDCFIAGKWQYDQYLKQYDVKLYPLTKMQNFNRFDTPIFIALSNTTDDTTVSQIRRSYQRLVENGAYQKLMQPLKDKLN